MSKSEFANSRGSLYRYIEPRALRRAVSISREDISEVRGGDPESISDILPRVLRDIETRHGIPEGIFKTPEPMGERRMHMNTAVSPHYTPREHIKHRHTPVTAKREELVCELSQLEDAAQADSEHARTLKAQIALCDELIGAPCSRRDLPRSFHKLGTTND